MWTLWATSSVPSGTPGEGPTRFQKAVIAALACLLREGRGTPPAFKDKLPLTEVPATSPELPLDSLSLMLAIGRSGDFAPRCPFCVPWAACS